MKSLAVWMPLVIVGLVLLYVVIGIRFARDTGAEISPARRGSAHNKESENGPPQDE